MEKKRDSKRSITNKVSKAEMAGLIKMSLFVGTGDGKESPADFLADVEMAARSWNAVYGQETDEPDTSRIAIFRQNLDRDGDAWHWWSCVLGQETKSTYDGIKKAFLARYEVPRNKAIARFNVQNELMLLQQRSGQTIDDYVLEAERLSERVPADMDNMLAMVFIRGLADQESPRRISYDLRDDPEFTFKKALRMVKSWYQEIGVPDPFNPNSVGFHSYREILTAPVYAKPASGAAITTAQINGSNGNIPKEEKTITMPTQEEFNRMMMNFMGTWKPDFHQAPHKTPSVSSASPGGAQPGLAGRTGLRTAPENTVCFNCGQAGHYSSGCTNSPLTYAEQRKIREEVRVGREARTNSTTVNSGAAAVRVLKATDDQSRITEVETD